MVLRSTSVIAQQQAAQSGLGLVILPCYMAEHDPLLVAVLAQEFVEREYWLATRRELHGSLRLRVVWDFLLQLCEREQGVLLGRMMQ